MKIPFDLRLKMVQYSFTHSISETARVFATTRDTVRKWVKRYSTYGTKGLMDQSKAPKTIPPHNGIGSSGDVTQKRITLINLMGTKKLGIIPVLEVMDYRNHRYTRFGIGERRKRAEE